MELKDTIEQMTSPDYKERFKAEYKQLRLRYEKLNKFLNTCTWEIQAGREEPKHDCPLWLLELQLEEMKQYLRILEIRSYFEHIDVVEEMNGKV